MALPTPASLTVTRTAGSTTGPDRPNLDVPSRPGLGPAPTSGLRSRGPVPLAAQQHYRAATSAIGDAGRVGR
nr:hypothetical protein [Micromonospora sp. DSM 115978]